MFKKISTTTKPVTRSLFKGVTTKLKVKTTNGAFSGVNQKVFTEENLKNSIEEKHFNEFLKSRKTGEKLEKSSQNAIAEAMKSWAIEHGCITYTHWFSPLRGYNAEKYDSFIDRDFLGDIIVDFSGSKLFTGETDGSRFPC